MCRGRHRHRTTRPRTAPRGWFSHRSRRLPAVVAQGTLTADRILLNARALGVYGSSPIPQSGGDTLASHRAISSRRGAPMPRRTDAGAIYADQVRPRPTTAIWWRISPKTCEYDDEQARLAGIQRLLVIAG